MLKDKLKACGTHFFFSAVIVLAFIALVYYIWFTPAFFVALDAFTPLKILILVDVILGPLLTFIVYKKGKKTLKMDLTVIIVLQIVALGYGAYSTYQGRPILMYLDEKAYSLVLQKDLQEISIKQTELVAGPFSKPKIGVIPDIKLVSLALPQQLVDNTSPINSNYADVVQRRQLREINSIERLIKLDESAFLQKLESMNLDYDKHLFHMVVAQDILHLLISDPDTFEPLALLSDPELMQTL
ncbi:hypothetical protein [Marinicella sp. W31]|uniref:hypothetical protein n=1 Tax=Marinicella sp. W31 TaxID=3023713 RepID=UPI0037572256